MPELYKPCVKIFFPIFFQKFIKAIFKSNSTIYPWNQKPWQRWTDILSDGRIAHAFLLYGQVGCGEQAFALFMAQSILCTGDRAKPCQICRECKMCQHKVHPDLLLVDAAQGQGGAITAPQVRQANLFLSVAGRSNSMRVVLYLAAEKLNYHACGSLLKTLEEPPPNCVIILLEGSVQSTLPLTIKSRCQLLRLTCDDSLAVRWLSKKIKISEKDAAKVMNMFYKSPLTAQKMYKSNEEISSLLEDLDLLSESRLDVMTFSKKWQKMDGKSLHEKLLQWLENRIKNNVICRNSLSRGRQTLRNRKLLDLHGRQAKRWNLSRTRTALNMQLLLESALIDFTSISDL